MQLDEAEQELKQAETCMPLLWTSVFLFSFLLIFKTVNSWLEVSSDMRSKDETACLYSCVKPLGKLLRVDCESADLPK